MRKAEKKNTWIKAETLLIALLLLMLIGSTQAMAASSKAITMVVGKKATVELNVTNKSKAKWKSSKKSIVTVQKKNGGKAKLTAKKAGKATVTATIGKKKYTFKITVNAASTSTTTKSTSTTTQNVVTKTVAAAVDLNVAKTPVGGNLNVLSTSTATYTVAGQSVTGSYDAKVSSELVSLINQYRQSNGKSALSLSEVLISAAGTRAREASVLFSHQRPDGTSNFTVSPYAAGENLSSGYATAQEIFQAWKASTTHNAVMLQDDFNAIGVAVFARQVTVYGNTMTVYYAVMEAGR